MQRRDSSVNTWLRVGVLLTSLAVCATGCTTDPTPHVAHIGIPCEVGATFRPVAPNPPTTVGSHQIAGGMTARLETRRPGFRLSRAYLVLVRPNTRPGPGNDLARSPVIRASTAAGRTVGVSVPRGLADGHYPVFGVVRGRGYCGPPHLTGPAMAVNKIGMIAVIHG